MQRRGDNNNLLVGGSVALSPDVIARLRPVHGAAVYVGNTKVGYYDDKTASSHNGQTLTNRVDLYDPTGSLGLNTFQIKTNDVITINNLDVRQQIPNPPR
jgi:hypothetical protein